MERYQEIVALEVKAETAFAARRYQEALLAHSRALSLAQELKRPRLAAVIFNRIGQVLETDGEIQKAVVAYESALRALAADPALDTAQVLESLGAVGKGYDFRDVAIPDLYSEREARVLDVAEADPAIAVRLLIDIGNAYLRQPQETPAVNAYELALRRPEIAGAPLLRAYALANIGEVRRRRGETEAAEAALREALALLEAHADPRERRRALALLAGIERDRGQVQQALQHYREALALYAEAADVAGEARARAGLGRLHLQQGRFAEAGTAYRRAVELAEQVDDEEVLWHALWGLGRCLQAAGRLDEAAASFERGLALVELRRQALWTDEGKVTFLESVQDLFDQLIAVHLERAERDAGAYHDALAVAERARGRALHDLMGGRQRMRPVTGGTIRPARLRPLSEPGQSPTQMASGVPSGPEGSAPWAQMAPGFAVPSNETPPWIQMAPGIPSPETEEPAAPGNDPAPSNQDAGGVADRPTGEEGLGLEPAAVAPAPPPLARLVFHLLSDRTAIFVVTPEGRERGHVVPVGRENVAGRVAELRDALGTDYSPRGLRVTRHVRPRSSAPAKDDPGELLRSLYDLLIAPVAGLLPADGTPLVIEPHGVLWLVPFAALQAPDGSRLVDRCPLLYSPSAQVLAEIRVEPDYGAPGELKALLVGNPTMPPVPARGGLEMTLLPLPGAEEEARTIAAFFPEARRRLLLGQAADRATVEAEAPSAGILHLATHGVAYADDPLASFVALAELPQGGGLLTARDAMSLSLPADLVALSACQTGLGQLSGDGMIGLCRAFLVAGARAVLVSQWSVSDEATAALMVAFYRDYLQLDNKAVALQRAMQAVRASPEYADPKYWAPFVVVGAEA